MENINQHIEYNKAKLEDPLTSSQSRRHYEEELENLQLYHERHPEDTHDPTSLELFCDSHPDAVECKIYED